MFPLQLFVLPPQLIQSRQSLLLIFSHPLIYIFRKSQILEFIYRHQISTSIHPHQLSCSCNKGGNDTHLSIRHFRYDFARILHSGSLFPRTLLRQARYSVITGLHSPVNHTTLIPHGYRNVSMMDRINICDSIGHGEWVSQGIQRGKQTVVVQREAASLWPTSLLALSALEILRN